MNSLPLQNGQQVAFLSKSCPPLAVIISRAVSELPPVLKEFQLSPLRKKNHKHSLLTFFKTFLVQRRSHLDIRIVWHIPEEDLKFSKLKAKRRGPSDPPRPLTGTS